MPTSSSLVTNLPADFNTFGQGVDTSLQDLLGGTTGQVLSKTSNTNMDFTWVTPTDQTPLTTKGDIFAFSTVDARLPAGTNETRLVADSTQTLGLKYVADTTNYAIAAKGDLLAGTAADTLQALSVGTNGQTLVADSTASTGLKWATPTATTFPAFRACTNAQQTIAANTFTKITFGAETFDTDNCFASNRFTPTTAGYYFFHWTLDLSGVSIRQMFFYKNGSDCGNIFLNATTSHTDMTNSNFIYMNGTTDYMEVYAYCNASTVVENGTVDSYFEGFGVRA